MTSKVAFITGSAKRIGACTAKRLHKAGYNIVIHCNSSVAAADELKQTLNNLRPESAVVIQGNLTDYEQLPSIAEKAKSAFGRIDVLVNNASAFYPTPIGTVTLSDWNQLIGSNAQAPLFLSQRLKDELTMNNGVIINMTDIHAAKPLASHTVYCMAKSALVTMTQSLAKELAPNVRVNAVSPGAILWPEQPLNEDDKNQILSEIPLNRLGTEADIADTIHFLITAPYITGQIIAVDGGRSLGATSKA
ncbi:pteridine reductase [Alteromonadaceae bacterium M269]|nr:pteridine reductase [Alteromonadaceae bacterium M269]